MTQASVTPRLVPEFEYHADVSGIHDVGPGPLGRRMIGTIAGGALAGERLKGSIVGAGAEWLLLSSDGFGRLDTRTTFRTVDGAHIYMQFSGLLEMTPAVMALLSGGDTPTDFGDQYFFIDPRLETGDERYSWVNQTLFVGQGRHASRSRVEFRVYRVENA